MLNAFGNVADVLSEASAEAASTIQQQFQSKRNEEAVSDQFIATLRSEINRAEKHAPASIGIRTETLSAHSLPYAEKTIGADFFIAYGFFTENYQYGTGVLFQAKMYDKLINSTSSDQKSNTQYLTGLREDCEKMLRFSPSSFGVVYSENSFRHYPAEAIAALEQSEFEHRENYTITSALHSHRVRKFYEMLFRGFIGDEWVFRNVNFILNPEEYGMTPTRHRPRLIVLPDGAGENEYDDREIAGLRIIVEDKESDESEYTIPSIDSQYVV